jgi:hypothetical protein
MYCVLYFIEMVRCGVVKPKITEIWQAEGENLSGKNNLGESPELVPPRLGTAQEIVRVLTKFSCFSYSSIFLVSDF